MSKYDNLTPNEFKDLLVCITTGSSIVIIGYHSNMGRSDDCKKYGYLRPNEFKDLLVCITTGSYTIIIQYH